MVDPINSNNSVAQTYSGKIMSDVGTKVVSEVGMPINQRQSTGEEHLTDVKVEDKKIIDAIEKANKQLEIKGTSLRFSIHKITKQIMVKIVSDETEEVIKEVPPEKILDMVADMMVRAGIIVDKRG